jgi:hypothetical protein
MNTPCSSCGTYGDLGKDDEWHPAADEILNDASRVLRRVYDEEANLPWHTSCDICSILERIHTYFSTIKGVGA